MNQTTNYNFNLPEGSDLVNLLTQLIPNWSNLDSILKGVENQAFTNCTEVTSLGVHAISRTNADGKILKWIATANFTAGDTFTVDGNVVAASTPAGATLATGAYITGAVIIAALNSDESAMTIFVSGTNVATDSERLGGELPSYYAKDSDMETAKQAIEDLDNLMGTTSISAIGDGTVTGAISAIKSDLDNDTTTVTAETNYTVSNVVVKKIGALHFVSFTFTGTIPATAGGKTVANLGVNLPHANTAGTAFVWDSNGYLQTTSCSVTTSGNISVIAGTAGVSGAVQLLYY